MSDEKEIIRIQNRLSNSGMYENVVQAGVVHGGIHVHQGPGDSQSALENPVIVTVHRLRDFNRLVVDADPPRRMVPSGVTYIVTLEAWTTRAVVLHTARVVVLSRRLPRPSCVPMSIGALVTPRHFETNLDLTGFDGDSPQLHAVGPDFPFSISATDVEQFRFTASAETEEVCWQVELDWSCAGREGTIVINDNGRPFETYPLDARATLPGSWALRSTCDVRDGPDCPRLRLKDNAALAPADWAQSIGIQDVYRTVMSLASTMQDVDPDDPETWPAHQRLAIHVRTLLGQQRFHSHESEPFRVLLVRVIRYFYVSQQSQLGVQIARPVHRSWETHLGEDHPHTLALANRLAGCLCGVRDFDQARVLWENILPRLQKTLGNVHSDTLTVTSNLALALGQLGELETAEKLAGEALRKSKQALGEDHLTTRRSQRLVRDLAALRENRRDS